MRTAEEITEIYNREADTVWRICRSFMGSVADAEDMVQETFLKLMQNDSPFASQDHERGWLIVTASNLCKNALRRRDRISDDIADHPELAGDQASEELEILSAIRSLPEDDQTVVYLHYYEGYRTEEIADLLGVKPSTIRSRLTRARSKLRKMLEEE